MSRGDRGIVLNGVALLREVPAGLDTRHATPPSQAASAEIGHSSIERRLAPPMRPLPTACSSASTAGSRMSRKAIISGAATPSNRPPCVRLPLQTARCPRSVLKSRTPSDALKDWHAPPGAQSNPVLHESEAAKAWPWHGARSLGRNRVIDGNEDYLTIDRSRLASR